MSLIVPCLTCGAKIRVADKYLGKHIRCPCCKMGVAVKASTAKWEQSDGGAQHERDFHDVDEASASFLPPASPQRLTSPASRKPSAPHSNSTSSGDNASSHSQVPDELEFVDEEPGKPAWNPDLIDDLEFVDEEPLPRLPPLNRRRRTQPAAEDPKDNPDATPSRTKKKPKGPFKNRVRRKSLGSGPRDALVWVLLAALLPLAVIIVIPPKPLVERIRETQLAEPDLQSEFEEDTPQEVLAMNPDLKIAGAHLSRHTKMHWLYALVSAGTFLALLSGMRSQTQVSELRLLLVGVQTGTIGVIMLIVFQFLAEVSLHTRVIGAGAGALFMMILRLIGFSYRCAMDPDTGLLLSFVGFTCGVGLCEELCKAWPVMSYLRGTHKSDWRGACLLGFASGAGFGISEGIMYSASYYNGIEPGMIYLVRFASCVALHSIWSGSVALMMFGNQEHLELGDDWVAYVFGLLYYVLIAMILHGLYDTLLKRNLMIVALVVAFASFAWTAWLSRYYWDYEES